MFALIFLLYSLTFAVQADGGSFIDPIGGAHTDSGVRIDPEG
jgi:hypothetical protein